jgi:hypothetical protein
MLIKFFERKPPDHNAVIGNWMRNRNTIEYLGIWDYFFLFRLFTNALKGEALNGRNPFITTKTGMDIRCAYKGLFRDNKKKFTRHGVNFILFFIVQYVGTLPTRALL